MATSIAPVLQPQQLVNASANEPNYQRAEYLTMSENWRLCQNVKAGTQRIRENRAEYLPKFESETPKDWDARVKMTFCNDYYDQTLGDLVGLIFQRQPKVMEDGKAGAFDDFLEDVDGVGTHFEVFLKELQEAALDWGHAAILTDYPKVERRPLQTEMTQLSIKPYWSIILANQIVNWRTVKVQGVEVLCQVTIKEQAQEPEGTYGVRCVDHYRTYTQAYTEQPSAVGGKVTTLGAITYRVQRQVTAPGARQSTWEVVDEGVLRGPSRIPLRVVYGGKRTGVCQSVPFLKGLAITSLEETQVKSDYANVMHKCNVPTPVFIGRGATDENKPVQMGQGIDIPIGGDAKMLEPTGVALTATRERLQDIQAQLRRQGAAIPDATASRHAMTATEANLNSQQRNARLTTAARSLQDGAENALEDVALFMGLTRDDAPSVDVLQDFAAAAKDPAYLTLVFQAWQAGLLPADAALYALKNGQLPDEFDVEQAAIQAMSQSEAVMKMVAQGQNVFAQGGGDPNRPPTDPNDPPLPAADPVA